MPETVRAAYHSNVRRLLALPFGTDLHGDRSAHVVKLTPEAYRAWLGFAKETEPRLHRITGDLGDWRDWASKLPGAVIRLAGLFHLAEHVSETASWSSG